MDEPRYNERLVRIEKATFSAHDPLIGIVGIAYCVGRSPMQGEKVYPPGSPYRYRIEPESEEDQCKVRGHTFEEQTLFPMDAYQDEQERWGSK